MKVARRTELADFWRHLGVQPARPLLCHSFISTLGRPETSPQHDIVGSLLDVIGADGTLFVPAFTYSYFNSQIYDRQHSRSTVGILADWLLSMPGSFRSLSPNFSHVGFGPDAEKFLARQTKRALGPDTVYDRLVQANAQVLMIGVDFTALPLFMHMERVLGVHYRYDKSFPGLTRDNGVEFEDVEVHSVRDQDLDFVNDRHAIGVLVDHDPRCRMVSFGYGTHRLIDAQVVTSIVEKTLREDPHAMIRFQSEAGRKLALEKLGDSRGKV